jgi:hypothetical protein
VKKAARKIGTVGALTAAIVLGFSQMADAATSESDVYTNGTAAGKAWFNSGPNDWVIRDTKCDNKPVYIKYMKGSLGIYTHWYSGGCNTEERHHTYGHGYSLGYQICVGPGLPWDDCGNWVTDRIP